MISFDLDREHLLVFFFIFWLFFRTARSPLCGRRLDHFLLQFASSWMHSATCWFLIWRLTSFQFRVVIWDAMRVHSKALERNPMKIQCVETFFAFQLEEISHILIHHWTENLLVLNHLISQEAIQKVQWNMDSVSDDWKWIHPAVIYVNSFTQVNPQLPRCWKPCLFLSLSLLFVNHIGRLVFV